MAALLPLHLSAKRATWRVADGHASESDIAFQAIRVRVLQRDDHTCRFCGLRAEKYQEVHHLDDNHANNKPDNLVTACCLCHQCFHVGLAGMHGGGKIIYLPELSQADLHHMVRGIFVAVQSENPYKEAAMSLYAALSARGAVANEIFARNVQDASLLGQALLDMPQDSLPQAMENLAPLRLLPLPGRFGPQTSYWREHVYGALPPETWAALAEPLRAA